MPRKSEILSDDYFSARSMRNDVTGCVEWTLRVTANGYGQAKHKRKPYAAHRLMWEYKFGPIPEGMVICHKCDNRKCINPDHLFIGTTQDNVDDKMAKGRFAPSIGEKSGGAKLTDAQIVAIRNDVRRQHVIAKEYGISQSNVSLIKSGKAWGHAGGAVGMDKRMNIREFAMYLGLPYQSLKDRIYGGYMSIGEAVYRTAKQFGVEIKEA